MGKRRIAYSHNTKKGILDNDYTLFDNGEVLHEYDKSQYPGQYNLSETLSIDRISESIKSDFLKSAESEDLELVKKLLSL
ncbi:hypothetical protein JXM83_00065 [Candidatus Woesearchaeota archaeon]|nr:hypothetical protein [Candidatus Delongbacteria bacterium]MBN2880426.1 hypothetical protein [Candidatus Woesearchaeota archaeon]